MCSFRIMLWATLFLTGTTSYGLAGPYGALATSPNADFGYSYNYDYEDDAIDRALQECRRYSSACELKQTFRNVCVSVAKASNGAMGWSWGFGRGQDDRNALQTCRENRGPDCHLAARFCTGNP